jgi:hypothetical protein
MFWRLLVYRNVWEIYKFCLTCIFGPLLAKYEIYSAFMLHTHTHVYIIYIHVCVYSLRWKCYYTHKHYSREILKIMFVGMHWFLFCWLIMIVNRLASYTLRHDTAYLL